MPLASHCLNHLGSPAVTARLPLRFPLEMPLPLPFPLLPPPPFMGMVPGDSELPSPDLHHRITVSTGLRMVFSSYGYLAERDLRIAAVEKLDDGGDGQLGRLDERVVPATRKREEFAAWNRLCDLAPVARRNQRILIADHHQRRRFNPIVDLHAVATCQAHQLARDRRTTEARWRLPRTLPSPSDAGADPI